MKKVLFGSGQQFIVNDPYYLGYSSGAFVRFSYDQALPQHSWLRVQRATTGTGAGLPNGEVSFSNSEYRLFYFSTKNMTSYVGGGNYILADIGSVAKLGGPSNIYNYTDVT